MKIVGVIDLLGGRAVRAVAGQRDRYRPVDTVAGCRIEPGDAAALARYYMENTGVSDLYVADLDRILARGSHDGIIAALAELPIPLWVDAGVSGVEEARHIFRLGATSVIVGLETLQSFEALEHMCSTLGGRQIAFSLDLRHGRPVKEAVGGRPTLTAADAARYSVAAGVGTIVIIDIARVGTPGGPDMSTIRSTLSVVPDIPVLAGGGVRNLEDIYEVASAGCEGVLVATSLQDGTLTPAHVEEARRLHSRPLA